MSDKEIKIVTKTPTPKQYNNLRKAVGWHCLEYERTEKALNKSLFSVCAIANKKVIGFGRIVGDGIYFYIQDVIVEPKHQGQGIGHKIMKRLMKYLDSHAPKKSGAFVGLMIAPGIESFYHQYGFDFLPDDSPFMCSWRNGH